MVVLREILIWEFFSYFFPLKQNYECCKKEKKLSEYLGYNCRLLL